MNKNSQPVLIAQHCDNGHVFEALMTNYGHTYGSKNDLHGPAWVYVNEENGPVCPTCGAYGNPVVDKDPN